MPDNKLSSSFYQRSDVVSIARELIGKVLCTCIDDTLTSGVITETEAYCGRGDKACHASMGRRTDRTETMYQAGGIAYVYLCYGIHHLFNIVTNKEDKADAVLVRAVKPLDGKEKMLYRRGFEEVEPGLTAGPGRLSEALGITTDYDKTDLTGDTIWIENRGLSFSGDELVSATRIGVAYAEEDAKLPWRFYPERSKWVSQK